MIISFVNQKGGVGKTTTAINLAASLTRRNYRIVLVDLDPQGSATKWHGVEGNQAFEVLPQPAVLTPLDVDTLSNAYDYVIIDAPPSICEITRAVLAISDIAVIPVSPSSLDLWACTDTLNMIEAIQSENPGLEVKFLINRKIPGTRTGREIRDALSGFETNIIETELCQRVAYVESMKYGVSVVQFAPASKAAEEIERLSNELVKEHDQADETEMDPIAALYQDETDNILFRSFQSFN